MSNNDNQTQFYHSFVRNMPHLMYIVDKDCVLETCNKEFLQYLGVTTVKEVGSSLYRHLIKQCQWSEARAEQLKKDDIKALLSASVEQVYQEKPVIAACGQINYYTSTRFPILDEHKQVVGLVVILMDITKQIELEEQLVKMRQQLQASNEKTHASMDKPHENISLSRSPRILLIEDNMLAQKAGQALLMQLDCKVEVAASYQELKRLFEPGKYDLILMDIGFKDTSGYVLSKKIRHLEQSSHHKVPIIALTGYEADVVQYDCVDYFMEGAITKPLTSKQAKQLIQHYIYHIDIPVDGLKAAINH